MQHEFERDAVAPLDGSLFEPKTPFQYGGVMHNPAQEGSGINHGYQHGADMIEVSHAIVMAEIEKGLHSESKRPISGLLNHCVVAKASPESRQALVDFYATVKKRKSARKRTRIATKKKEVETRTEIKEESFGVVDGGNGTKPLVEAKPPVKKKGGRKKGSKNKAKATVKKNVEKITATT